MSKPLTNAYLKLYAPVTSPEKQVVQFSQSHPGPMPTDQQIDEIKSFFSGKASQIETVQGMDLVFDSSSPNSTYRAKREADLQKNFPADYAIVMNLRKLCLPQRIETSHDATFPVNSNDQKESFINVRSGDKMELAYKANLPSQCPVEMIIYSDSKLAATDKIEKATEGKLNGQHSSGFKVEIKDEDLKNRLKLKSFEITSMINVDTLTQVAENGVVHGGYGKGSYSGSFANLERTISFDTTFEVSGDKANNTVLQTIDFNLASGKTTLTIHAVTKDSVKTTSYYLNGNSITEQRLRELFATRVSDLVAVSKPSVDTVIH